MPPEGAGSGFLHPAQRTGNTSQFYPYLNHYVARAWVHDPAHDGSQGLEPYAAEPTPDEWPDSEGWYDGWEPSTPLEDLRLVLELVSAEIQRLEPN